MTTDGVPTTAGARLALLLAQSPALREPLALALGLELPDLVAVLDGRRQLALSDLITAADVLDIPATYLSGQAGSGSSLAVSLRLGQAQQSGAPEQALNYGSMLIRHLALLDLWQGVTVSVLDQLGPHYGGLHAEAGALTANKVRSALGLEAAPIADLVSLVESCGVPVAFQPLPSQLSGINLRDDQDGMTRRAIIVNCDDYWTRQRFTLAHELCHSLYNDAGQVIVDEVSVSDALPEIRAESFARHLLLPKSALSAIVSSSRSAGSGPAALVAYAMVTHGVSRDVVLKALVDDGHVPKTDERIEFLRTATVEKIMKSGGQSSVWSELCERQQEPSGSPWLVDRAVRAYGDGLVDVSVVADLLGEDERQVSLQLAEAGW